MPLDDHLLARNRHSMDSDANLCRQRGGQEHQDTRLLGLESVGENYFLLQVQSVLRDVYGWVKPALWPNRETNYRGS